MYKKLNHRNFSAVVWAFFAALMVGLFNATEVFAMTPPASGTPGYELYTVIHNVLTSPIMTIVGISAIIAGAAMAWMNKIMSAIPIVIGGAAIANAESLTSILGATF